GVHPGPRRHGLHLGGRRPPLPEAGPRSRHPLRPHRRAGRAHGELPVGQSTSSAIVRRIGGGPLSSIVVTIDERHSSTSSRIFSFGPTRAISSTIAVGTRAAASSLRPPR